MEQVSSTPSANFNEAKPGGSYKITFRKIARAALAELRVHKKIAIISYVLFGVSTLLFIFNAEFYSVNRPGGAYFSPSGWGAVFGAMGILVGFFAALNIFRDVNNQQFCDVTMALPIKAVERYLSKLLALFFLQVGPLIIAALGGNAVAMLFGKISFGALNSESTEFLLMVVFGGLSVSLFIMAVAVLCACCCGAPAESAYFSIILMFVINALPSTFVNHIVGKCSGFDTSWLYGGAGNVIDVKFWGFLPLFSGGYNNNVGDFVFHNVISIVLSLIVFFLAIFIYKKRDAKTVGTPIASRVFFEVMMALGCFTLFSFFGLTTAAWWGVLIAGVIYIIINVIVSRAKISAMSFFKWIVKYAVTTAAFAVLMVVTIKTGGFGQIYSRPAAEYLEDAEFRIVYYDFGYSTNRTLVTGELSAEQADQVMDICKKHIVKGRNELSAAQIMLDSGGIYRTSAAIHVRANSDKDLRNRPAQMRHFRRNRISVKNSDYWYYVYNLDYSQDILISVGEGRALIDELQSLDFMNRETYEDGRVVITQSA